MTEGIDLYTKYQTVTDWNKVRAAGKTFCYVKVSDGTAAKATSGWGPAGRKAGVAMGAYHYAQPGDPVAQADLLISQASGNGLTDLGPALDLEAPFVPGATAANFAIAFLRRLRDRGFLPVLYGSDSMLSYVAPQVRAAVPETWIWVARYGATPKTPWKTWQHSSNGTVPGITASAVDLNTGSIPLEGSDMAGFDGTDYKFLMWDAVFDDDGKGHTQNFATYVKLTLKAAVDTANSNAQAANSNATAAKAAVAAVGAAVADVQSKVTALSAPQIDYDALAAKVAPLINAGLADAVVAALKAHPLAPQ